MVSITSSHSNPSSHKDSTPSSCISGSVSKDTVSGSPHTGSVHSATSPSDKPLVTMSSIQAGNSDAGLGSLEFALNYDAVECTLQCHLVKAKDLKAMDVGGLSDPYVKLHLLPAGNLKAYKLRSATIENCLEPVWNESLTYHGVLKDDLMKKTLRIQVLDEDPVGFDFLGELRIPLSVLLGDKSQHCSLYLQPSGTAPEDDVGEAANYRGRILIGLRYNKGESQLDVAVKRGVALLAMNSSGLSDPFVKLSLSHHGNKKQKEKSSIKKQTLNPLFDEVFKFKVAYSELSSATLDVDLWDKNTARRDDYLGGIKFNKAAKNKLLSHWRQVIEQPERTHFDWHDLTDNRGK